MSKRKTFYHICSETGELEKVRRVICPEGWSEDKEKVLAEAQKAKLEKRFLACDVIKGETIDISSRSGVKDSPSFQEIKPDLAIQLKSLRDALAKAEKENAVLKLQNKNHQEQIKALQQAVQDSSANEQKRLASSSLERRQERDLLELEKTALIVRKTGLKEEEFYAVKNQLNGLQLQVCHFQERIKDLQDTLESSRTRNRNLSLQIESLNKAIANVKDYMRAVNFSQDLIRQFFVRMTTTNSYNEHELETLRERVVKQQERLQIHEKQFEQYLQSIKWVSPSFP